MALVSLDKLVDGLDEQSTGEAVFLDRETGEIIPVSQEALDAIEDEVEEKESALMDWEQAEREAARKVLDEKRYLPFPDRSEIHEWQIMEDFSEQVRAPNIRKRFAKLFMGRAHSVVSKMKSDTSIYGTSGISSDLRHSPKSCAHGVNKTMSSLLPNSDPGGWQV